MCAVLNISPKTYYKYRNKEDPDCNDYLIIKETLYNNNITSLQEYIQLVEEWILFYNTFRLKSKNRK